MARILRQIIYIVLLSSIVTSVLPLPLLKADEAISDWLKAEPVISSNVDLPIGELIPYSVNGNRECIEQRIVTRPRKALPYWPYWQQEQSHESCIVNTSYGAVSLSGYLQVPGENTFGTVHYPWGKKMTLFPVPNATGAIYLEPNLPNGSTMTLIPDFLSSITATTLANGEIYYTVKNGTATIPLKGSDNKPLGVAIESVSFSFGGKWMVADIPYLGLTRIDTASFSMKTFDPAYFNYNIGLGPSVQSAVTASGRYVAMASSNYTRFRLYDLENCSDNKNCRSLDLQSYFSHKMPGFIGAHRLRFGSDYSLRLYVLHQPPGKAKIVTGLNLRAFGHDAAGYEYLGLGDSFASGEGAFQYKAITDTDDNECHLSLRSYPYLIGSQLNLNSYDSVACSGAVINDVYDFDHKYPDDPQARNKNGDNFDSEIYQNLYPGYRTQYSFIDKISPEVITLSISGNDIGFSDKLKKCLMPGTCYKYYEDRLEAVFEINNQLGRLYDTYSRIKAFMPNKKVYVIGYPEIVFEGGVCYGNVYLDREEVKFANQLVRHLNGMIKAAASKAGFFYVDVEKSFVGHRLCETDYPNVAVNGITVGDDTNIPFTHIDLGGPIGNESFHPNDMGHRKLKEAILAKTSNLTAPMPAPDKNAKPPEITSDMELLKDAPRAWRDTSHVKYLGNRGRHVLRQEEIKGTIKMTESGFKPSSEVEVWIHSDPVKLAVLNTDEKGNLKYTLTIPQDTSYGFHTIHIYGTGLTGNKIDLQQVVQVIAEQVAEQPDYKIPVSNGDPKPPENNPETVAGHEQTNSEHGVLQELSLDNREVATNRATSPYFEPNTNVPQVAASQTETVTPVNNTNNSSENESGQQTNDDWWPYVTMAAALLLIISSLYPARRKLAKKKEE